MKNKNYLRSLALGLSFYASSVTFAANSSCIETLAPHVAKQTTIGEFDILMVGGFGVMGKGFTARMSNVGGLKVAVSDPNPHFAEIMKDENMDPEKVVPMANLEEGLSRLKSPRKIMFLVPNDKILEAVLKDIIAKKILEPGDILLDGGNTNWVKTEERQRVFDQLGVHYLGMGVSGGETGARDGSAMTASGNEIAWSHLKPILETIAAPIKGLDGNEGARSVTLVGPGGSGQFVKMAHNGIEYAELKLLGETYVVLRDMVGLSVPEIQKIFEQWTHTDLNSFLLRAAAKALKKTDDRTGEPLVTKVADIVGNKGTGAWTVENALKMQVYTPSLAEALFARYATDLYEKNPNRENFLSQTSVRKKQLSKRDREQILRDLPKALIVARLLAFNQGFNVIQAASKQAFNNKVDMFNTTQVWRAGSILVGPMLDRLNKTFWEAKQSNTEINDLLDLPEYQQVVQTNIDSLRRVSAISTLKGVSTPLYSSAFQYAAAYRDGGDTGGGFIAAIRDAFGAHTFMRNDDVVEKGQDRPKYHVDWNEEQH